MRRSEEALSWSARRRVRQRSASPGRGVQTALCRFGASLVAAAAGTMAASTTQAFQMPLPSRMPGRARLHIQRLETGHYDVIAAPPRAALALAQVRSCPDRGPAVVGKPLAAAVWTGQFRSFDEPRLHRAFQANVLQPFQAEWRHFFYIGSTRCRDDQCQRGHSGVACREALHVGNAACSATGLLDEVVAASLAAFCNIEEAFYGELPEAGEPGFHQRCPEQQDQLWSQYLRTFLAFRAAYGYEARAGVNFDWFLRLRTDTLFLLPIPSHGTFQAGITVAIENDAHMSDQFAVVSRDVADVYFGFQSSMECTSAEQRSRGHEWRSARLPGAKRQWGHMRRREAAYFHLFPWLVHHNASVHEVPIGFVLVRPSGPSCGRLQAVSVMNRAWENPKLLERLREFEPKLMTLALQCQQLLKLWEAGKPLIVQKRIPRVRFAVGMGPRAKVQF